MVRHCFPDLSDPFGATDSCILTTLNKHVDELNAQVLLQQAGEEHVFKSADFFGPDAADEEQVYPIEVLNTLLPSNQSAKSFLWLVVFDFILNALVKGHHLLNAKGMAPHELRLRVGAPVVFLRNLNREQGMMNGTRGIILAVRKYTVQVKAFYTTSIWNCEIPSPLLLQTTP